MWPRTIRREAARLPEALLARDGTPHVSLAPSPLSGSSRSCSADESHVHHHVQAAASPRESSLVSGRHGTRAPRTALKTVHFSCSFRPLY